MKCVNCPAKRDLTEEPTNGLCKVGVNQATIERLGKNGCKYSAEQVNRWLKQKATPTLKDVLLKTWAQDTEAMANVMLEMIYDSEDDVYVFEDGFMTSDHEEALYHEIAYLDSAAEVGK